MIRSILVDAGPLVALLDCRDRFHEWAASQLSGRKPPLLTCEAVLAEAAHLLRHIHGGERALLEMVRRKLITAPFRLDNEVTRVAKLMTRNENIPMSLASMNKVSAPLFRKRLFFLSRVRNQRQAGI